MRQKYPLLFFSETPISKGNVHSLFAATYVVLHVRVRVNYLIVCQVSVCDFLACGSELHVVIGLLLSQFFLHGI